MEEELVESHVYNGSLTREQFLFFETRITATLMCQGLSHDEIIERVYTENLFQFPTERMIRSICKTCFKRLSALNSEIGRASCRARVSRSV